MDRLISTTNSSVIDADIFDCIEYVNSGFENLTGYNLDEVRGQKPGSILQGELTDKDTVTRISKKLKNRELFYEKILNVDKGGLIGYCLYQFTYRSEHSTE